MSGFAIASGLAEPLRVSCTNRVSGAILTRNIAEPFALFGRHSANAVPLDDPSVSKKHAYLQVIDGRPFVVDLGSRTGLRIAGDPVSQGWFDPGQVLDIGEFDIRISGTVKGPPDQRSPSALSEGSVAPRLTLASGGDSEGLIFCPLRCRITLIGRDPGCNFRLVDARLRPFHAAVVQTRTDAWLVDLLGSGETRINDRPVRSSLLRVGDRIGLNGVELEVELNRKDEARSEHGVLEPISNRTVHYTSASEAVQPLAEQVGDLRQATLLMAGLFGEMKREQSQLMHRQIELMEVMAEAFRGLRPGGVLPLAAAPTVPELASGGTPLQTPRIANPGDEEALAQAHEWFLSRLQDLGKQPH